MYNYRDSNSTSATFLDYFFERLCHCPLLDFWQKSLHWSESKLGGGRGGGKLQRKWGHWGSERVIWVWKIQKQVRLVFCMNMKHKWNDSHHARILLPLPFGFELPAHIEIVDRETNSAIVLTFHLVYQSCFQVKFLPSDSSVGRSQCCGLILLFLVLLSSFIQPLI